MWRINIARRVEFVKQVLPRFVNLRKDLSPSQLSVILTEHSIICIMFITVYYSLKMSYNNYEDNAHCEFK